MQNIQAVAYYMEGMGLGAARASNAGVWDVLQLTHNSGSGLNRQREADGRIGQVRASNVKLLTRS